MSHKDQITTYGWNKPSFILVREHEAQQCCVQHSCFVFTLLLLLLQWIHKRTTVKQKSIIAATIISLGERVALCVCSATMIEILCNAVRFSQQVTTSKIDALQHVWNQVNGSLGSQILSPQTLSYLSILLGAHLECRLDIILEGDHRALCFRTLLKQIYRSRTKVTPKFDNCSHNYLLRRFRGDHCDTLACMSWQILKLVTLLFVAL